MDFCQWFGRLGVNDHAPVHAWSGAWLLNRSCTLNKTIFTVTQWLLVDLKAIYHARDAALPIDSLPISMVLSHLIYK